MDFFVALALWTTEPSLGPALECKQADQRVEFAGESDIYFSDFGHFQSGSVDFKLVVVKCCSWGNFKSDARYSGRFEGDLHSLPFHN